MLDLEMDIEADLGIDSIKRVEILSSLEEKLPELPPVSPDRMGTMKTLGQISAFLSQKSNTHAALSPPAEAEPTSGGMERSENELPWAGTSGPEQRLPIERWAVSLAKTALIRRKTIAIPEGKRLYVLQDALGLSASIVQALADKNIPAELLFENSIPSLVETPDALSDAGGLVIVSNPETVDDDRDDAFLQKAFMLTRQCAPSLMRAAKLSGAVFATVTRLDGAFGFSGRTLSHPATGGLAGLLKTAAIEWETVACRALDIDPDWHDIDAIANAVAEELIFSNQPGPSEIGISPSHRYALELLPLPPQTRHASGLSLKASDVVVISGGARGVTAAAAAGLAQNTPATLILIGRSPFPAEEPTWLTGLFEPAEIKRAILENEFNNNGASPRDIERSYQNYMAGREILHTLDTLRTIGTAVQYRSMDIRDAEKIESLLNDIRSEFGPIRAVIHGAGVIDDRLIVDKTLGQFNRVLDTKVKGLRSLLKATKNDPLKYLVIFSSVAARFGNIGQADYAMANEALNKIARQEAARRGDCRVVAINWGPWDGGMVSPSLKREFLKNHIQLIPMQAGAECMLGEMAAGREHPIEIVIGSDPRPKDAPVQAAALPSPQEPAPEKERLSLLFKREIDTTDYPILDAHRLDGKAVVPFALMTEWFGHGALHENPGLVLHGIDDMRILKGIRLEDNKKIIRLFAGKASKKGMLYEVPVELRDGVLEGVDVIHSRARAILADSIPEPPLFTFAKDTHAEPYPRSIEEIYDKILFHGKPLRGIQEIITCSSRGMTAKILSAPLPSQWIKEHLRSSWISDPLALDCAFQMATLWCYEETGAVSLPSYCKQYRQYCTKFPGSGITAVLEVNDLAPHKMTGDITLLSGDRQVVAQLKGYEAVIDPSLLRAFKPHLS
jgi:NAD(P)-dependent dehydrogenase (short-subunit alcohol dehydrogenase family)